MFKKLIALSGVALALGDTPGLAAVTVGDAVASNCYPFSCGPTDGLTEYQQIYMHSAFPGSLTFNSVSFSLYPFNPSTDMDSATYTVSFYLTSADVSTLSSDLSSNLGAFLGVLGIFMLAAPMPAVLALSGSSISYDPSAGNLLMDVTISDPTVVLGMYASAFNADYTQVDTTRAYVNKFGAFGPGNDLNSAGLQTTFGVVVPEPATWLIMAVGFAALGFGAHARRRPRAPIRWRPLARQA